MERNKDLPRYSLDALPTEQPLAIWIGDFDVLITDFPDFDSAYAAVENPTTLASYETVVWVFDATQGIVEQSEDFVQFAGAVGLKRCIVYLSKCDKVRDPGRREVMKHEIRLGFNRHFASSVLF